VRHCAVWTVLQGWHGRFSNPVCSSSSSAHLADASLWHDGRKLWQFVYIMRVIPGTPGIYSLSKISWMFHILKINGMMPCCNLFMG